MRIRSKLFLYLVAFLCAAFVAYAIYLDRVVVRQFEGKRFAIPAKVYARPLELFVGARLDKSQIVRELEALGYRPTSNIASSGEFISRGNTLDIFLRSFRFWDGKQDEQAIRLVFSSEKISSLTQYDSQQNIDLIRVEPLFIGGIYPNQGEDRELIRLHQSPVRLLESLLIIEDKRFYKHRGIDPRGIARAAFRSIQGGRVEGGSTITQQLVKNFYLSSERSIRRKFNEMIMAVLLEARYEKNDILETYLNEVYLGQDNNRAIHGFGLASRFYFKKDIENLLLHESALLVAMLKGPTYFNPRKYPQRALNRRNLVIDQLAINGLIDKLTANYAKDQSLSVTPKENIGQSSYPAFLDLVVRQLAREYNEEDLRSEGLRIFTTLDPSIQNQVERSIKKQLDMFNNTSRKTKDNSHKTSIQSLEAAAIISNTSTGEIQALVGGYNSKYSGFNRALDASRQIGSLVKPAIYLTALKQPHTYSLLSTLDDSPLEWNEPGIETWAPQNYDHVFRGDVPMWLALAKSYNVPAARLGIDLGVDNVHRTLKDLGVEKRFEKYASSLLGTMTLTPLQVTQMYQTLAADGFYMPLRSIREVTQQDGTALNRYKLKIETRISKEHSYLITQAMQNVITFGTGASLKTILPKSLGVAGKTGTSDDLRDSWFAGFTGDKLGVIWIGKDDNSSTGLSGAKGALPIWGEIFSKIDTLELKRSRPSTISQIFVDTGTRKISQKCRGAFAIPFIKPKIIDKMKPNLSSKKDRTEDSRLKFKEEIISLSEFACSASDSEQNNHSNWFKRLFGK